MNVYNIIVKNGFGAKVYDVTIIASNATNALLQAIKTEVIGIDDDDEITIELC